MFAEGPAWLIDWNNNRDRKRRPAEDPFAKLGPKPPWLEREGSPGSRRVADGASDGMRTPWSAHEEARLRSALAFIPAIERKHWLRVGMAIHHEGWEARGYALWSEWALTVPEKYNEADQLRTWEGFNRRNDYLGKRVSLASVYFMASEAGWPGHDASNPHTQGDADAASAGSTNEQTEGAGPNAQRDKDHRAPSWRDSAFSAADLRMMTFEPVRYVLPRFIPEGLALLVGRPKVGKSWWVLDLCLACTSDRPTLGNLKPVHGDALYLALEDGKRRLQNRLGKLLPTFSGEWPKRLKLVPMGGWKRADQGGLDDIADWCRSVPNPVLVVVDTLERIRKPATGKSPLYSADYEAITGLQKIANEFGIAIIVLHHDRKSEADDAFDTVSGTLGLTGAADTILIIKRRPNGVVLYARGRDIEESETAMEFDKATCRWTILGAASEVLRSNERARVIAALKAAGQPLATKDIMIDAELRGRNAADILLSKMVKDGEIERVGRGRYNLSGANEGKNGQKERFSAQGIDSVDKNSDLSNLSDLSGGAT
jgi:hypothetical protein